MKKYLIIVMFATLLLTGCAKNSTTFKSYKTVNEYEQAMTSVKNNFPAFSFEGHLYNDAGDWKIKAYIKNKLVRQDQETIPFIMTAISSYTPDGLFIGDKRISLNDGPKTKEFYKLMAAYKLTAWNSPEFQKNITKKSFTSRYAQVNNIKCRMIHYVENNSNEIDVCVNDDYGVAVYYEAKGLNLFNKPFHERIEISKIKTNDLPKKFFYEIGDPALIKLLEVIAREK